MVSTMGQFFCRDDREREWMLETAGRLRQGTRLGFLAALLTVVACLPWLDAIAIVPVVLAALVLAAADRGGRIAALGPAWLAAQALLFAAVALGDGIAQGALAILIFPLVAVAGGGHPRRVVVAFTAATGVLMLIGGLLVEHDAIADRPPLLIAPLGVAIAVGLLGASVRRAGSGSRAAVIDPLTGMLSRAALHTRSAELAHQSALVGQPVGLMVCDVDRLTAINDEHGRTTGDRVLAALALRLRKHLRAFDLAYRLDGAQFVVLLPGATVDQGVGLADVLARAIRAEPVADLAVTASFGVAGSAAGETFDFETVLAAACTALAEAKRDGRDRVRPVVRAKPEPPGPPAR